MWRKTGGGPDDYTYGNVHCGETSVRNRLGKMAEWSNAAVLKTVEQRCSGGSNPSLSANKQKLQGFDFIEAFFVFVGQAELVRAQTYKHKKEDSHCEPCNFGLFARALRRAKGMGKRSVANPFQRLALCKIFEH